MENILTLLNTMKKTITIFSTTACLLITHYSESVAPGGETGYLGKTKIYPTEGFKPDISNIWLVSNTGVSSL